MQGATHYIEVWRSKYDPYQYNSSVREIEQLDGDLISTAVMRCTTLFIWKIKLKTNGTICNGL